MGEALFAVLHSLSNNRLRSLLTTIGIIARVVRPLKSRAFTANVACPLPTPAT
jgi:hypothetical protein